MEGHLLPRDGHLVRYTNTHEYLRGVVVLISSTTVSYYISPTYSLKLIMRDRAPNQHTVLRLVGASCWEGAFSLILGLLARGEAH